MKLLYVVVIYLATKFKNLQGSCLFKNIRLGDSCIVNINDH